MVGVVKTGEVNYRMDSTMRIMIDSRLIKFSLFHGPGLVTFEEEDSVIKDSLTIE